ncbi:phospholipase A1-like [Contarinia nasturtii]|uniref:phospholipase A1-like n=1 Tax=Contarinia nasturtii TaxID=265458 RepID=UPI0012D489B7|nr:phospholipase A1-like [Contarinia nasturtii]
MNFLCGCLALLLFIHAAAAFLGTGLLDINLFKCMRRKSFSCPHEDIDFILHTPKIPDGRYVDVRKPSTFVNFRPHEETAFIVHGFNGTARDKHMRYLKDAYLSRGFNVVLVDWKKLTYYPCYFSALGNTKLVAQCTAQVYAYLTYRGSDNSQMTCVGHSLGAHICGMVSNHLTSKQHKIIGLDPARPLIERHASHGYRLTRDDANVVQIIHTNAGTLGQQSLTGSLDLCINGGSLQPFCRRGLRLNRNRCSHFLSVCYLANAIFKHKLFPYKACPKGCVKNNSPLFGLTRYTFKPMQYSSLIKLMHIGQDVPEETTGSYCVQVDFAKHCPFNEDD